MYKDRNAVLLVIVFRKINEWTQKEWMDEGIVEYPRIELSHSTKALLPHWQMYIASIYIYVYTSCRAWIMWFISEWSELAHRWSSILNLNVSLYSSTPAIPVAYFAGRSINRRTSSFTSLFILRLLPSIASRPLASLNCQIVRRCTHTMRSWFGCMAIHSSDEWNGSSSKLCR